MSNEGLNQIIDAFTDEGGDIKSDKIAALKAGLLERENTVLDHLRQRAVEHGLAPSMMQLELMQTGLGNDFTTGEVEIVHAQAHAEMHEIQESIRRFREGQG